MDAEDVAVILGDNIFQDCMKAPMQSFGGGAHIFLKTVPDAGRFGVAQVDKSKGGLSIEEKLQVPKSALTGTGLLLYDNGMFDVIKTLKPSRRRELEITYVNHEYVRQGRWGYG